MPIRFRCRYCNQLLGIARRKAGQMVQCPTCHAQVAVPLEDQEPPPGPAVAPPALFERSDFEDMLQGSAREAHAPASPPPLPSLSPVHPRPAFAGSFDVERLNGGTPLPLNPPPLPSVGVVLSPARATALTVLGIVLLAIAFGLGLCVGRLLP
jgi:hypothetical protein